MVWKIKRVGCVAVLLASVLLARAQTVQASVYDDGNISNTYTQIFQDILDGLSPMDDYLFYRSGDYEYRMYVGDLECTGTTFTGSNLDLYILNYTQSGYTSSVYNYEKYSGQSVNVNCGSLLVYSNIGGYPTLIERGSYLEVAEIFLLVLVALCCLIRPIFGFTMRFSRSCKS